MGEAGPVLKTPRCIALGHSLYTYVLSVSIAGVIQLLDHYESVQSYFYLLDLEIPAE